MSELIYDYGERMGRARANEEKVLKFLKTEIYTTANVLAKLLNFKTVNSIYKVLNRMIRDEYLSFEEILSDNIVAKSVRLYGITTHGAVMAQEEQDDPLNVVTFQPSKVNLTTLQHRIDTQLLRIEAENAGRTWIALNNIRLVKGSKLPDGMILRPDGTRLAVEVERTAKSPKRYQEIANLYARTFKENNLVNVLYLFPDVTLKNRVQRIYSALPSLGEGINAVQLRDGDIFRLFTFMTYEEFSDYLNS